MKRFLILCVLGCAVLSACQADPTPLRSTPPVSTATLPPNTTGTQVPNPTRPALPSPVVTSVPATRRGPGGSIIVAGIGAPSHELTKLPEFVSRALFDTLLRVDPEDGHLLPGLAERWLVSTDAKTFVFILREGVSFSDGTPLTADDVAFTLNALASDDIRVNPAADFGPLEQVTATDTRTVSVTFREPYCAALTYIGTIPILPQHIFQDQDLANVPAEALIGTGPLVLKTWNENTLTFARNANYWNGAPQIVDWTFEGVPQAQGVPATAAGNQADIVPGAASLAGRQDANVAANEFYALAFNVKRTPLDDLHVRQALSMAIDRRTLAGAGPVPQSELETSLLPGFWAAAPVKQPAFDPARARQMLADAGWRDTDGDNILEKDGKPLEMTLWVQGEEPLTEQTAQLVRKQLADVGARAVLKVSDRILYLTRVFLHEFDLALVHFNIPLDPDQHYFWGEGDVEPGAGLNVTGYTNPAVQAALTAGNSAARCDMNARENAYLPVWEQIAQDTPMLFLFAPTRSLSVSSRVGGLAPSSFAGTYWNLNAWEILP